MKSYVIFDFAQRLCRWSFFVICCQLEVVSTYSYTYDDRGFIASETAIESLAGYAYDDKHNGRHTDGKHDDLYPHGTKHAKHDKDATFAYQIVETDRTFTYDAAGKLVSATETEDNYGTYIYTYEYDLMGNRTYMEKTLNGTVAEWHKYEYNESNQLVSEQLYNGKKTTSLAYTYDADGNRITETGKVGTDKVEKTYEYTVENRLAAVYDGDELLLAAAYDGDGNRVFQLNYNLHTDEDWKGNSGNGNGSNNNGKGNSKSSGTDDAGYGNATNAEEYNSQNQSGILFPVDGEVSDTEQSLIDKIKTTGKEKNYELIEYINDVNREYTEVLVEQNINGKLDTAYVYGNDRLSLDRFDGSNGYYLYDPRGSVTGITNEEGQLYQSYRYDAFGNITFGAPQYENEYTYNGESYNPNIESQYLRARFYDVVNGDFLTEDSYLGSINEPLTLNRYAYCIASPTNYQDPSGYAIETIFDIAAVGFSIYEVAKDPSPANWGWLALDVVSVFVPFLAGSYVFKTIGKFVKTMDKFDIVADMMKFGDKIAGLADKAASLGKSFGDELAKLAKEAIETAAEKCGGVAKNILNKATTFLTKTIPDVIALLDKKSDCIDNFIQSKVDEFVGLFGKADNAAGTLTDAARAADNAVEAADEAAEVVEEIVEGGSGGRLIPGTEGVVTGGDSTKLGKNMMESMGLPRGTNWTGHQAQHIIPAEMANHPVLQRIGMDLDDASNGLFLRTPADDISAMSRHRGYHSTYNEFVRTQLDGIDINQSVDVLQKQVYDLQQNLKYLQQSGLPLYPSQGATVDLWQRSLERIQ